MFNLTLHSLSSFSISEIALIAVEPPFSGLFKLIDALPEKMFKMFATRFPFEW